jgi:hypothetical protein
MRRLSGKGLLMALLASAAPAWPAWADEVQGTRSDRLVEAAHEIRVSLSTTHATLRVRRQVFNGGDRHDQAIFRIDVPARSVAVGLATLGSQNGRPFWFPGELMEAEAAAEKYRELTGIGGFYPKDPALLSWREQRTLLLQVFPCPPRAGKWVEYTLEMPTNYAGGRYHIELPQTGTERLAATASIVAQNPADRVFVGGAPLAAGASLRLDDETPLRVELERRAPPQFEAELASFELAQGRALTRFRVAAAPRLSVVPKQARVVVLLDGSASLSADGRLGAIEAARAYLTHFPDALVEVVVFDRKLRPRHQRLVPVSRALQDLRALTLAPQNGSDVDRALMYADTLLAREPEQRARRVLLLTDALTRSSLSPEALSAALATSGALLHVGVVAAGPLDLERDDGHRWARVTRPTGGLVWKAGVSSGDDPAQQRRVFEAWARPIALDHVTLSESLSELDTSDWLRSSDPPRLREGEAGEWLGLAKGAISAAGLRGELWTQSVEINFNADERAAQRWAALVFGSELLDELSEPEMMVLARRGGAVSPVTSYLAIEPGVRPSTEGLDWSGGLGEGIGFGSSACHGSGHGAARSAFDMQKYLEGRIQEQLTRCGASGRRLRLELETTRAEIVELTRFELDGPSSLALEHCVREGVWALVLPPEFSSESARYGVYL